MWEGQRQRVSGRPRAKASREAQPCVHPDGGPGRPSGGRGPWCCAVVSVFFGSADRWPLLHSQRTRCSPSCPWVNAADSGDPTCCVFADQLAWKPPRRAGLLVVGPHVVSAVGMHSSRGPAWVWPPPPWAWTAPGSQPGQGERMESQGLGAGRFPAQGPLLTEHSRAGCGGRIPEGGLRVPPGRVGPSGPSWRLALAKAVRHLLMHRS